MKYLLLFLFLTSCAKETLSKKDIEMAKCICLMRGSPLSHVAIEYRGAIEIHCKDGQGFTHYESTYTEGCSK